MPSPNTQWTVQPHGDLVALAENLCTVTGTIDTPLGPFERRMTVARLDRGGTVVFSPICLDAPRMRELEDLGEPSFIVVPSERHRLDVRPWRDRYPRARVLAPAGAVAKVSELVTVDDSTLELGDASVTLVTVPGTDAHEAAMVVTSQDGATVVINELIFNLPDRPGFGGWIMHLLGLTADHAHVPGGVRLRDVKDPRALATQLDAWAQRPGLRRVVVSHGNVIAADAAGVLARVAKDLRS